MRKRDLFIAAWAIVCLGTACIKENCQMPDSRHLSILFSEERFIIGAERAPVTVGFSVASNSGDGLFWRIETRGRSQTEWDLDVTLDEDGRGGTVVVTPLFDAGADTFEHTLIIDFYNSRDPEKVSHFKKELPVIYAPILFESMQGTGSKTVTHNIYDKTARVLRFVNSVDDSSIELRSGADWIHIGDYYGAVKEIPFYVDGWDGSERSSDIMVINRKTGETMCAHIIQHRPAKDVFKEIYERFNGRGWIMPLSTSQKSFHSLEKWLDMDLAPVVQVDYYDGFDSSDYDARKEINVSLHPDYGDIGAFITAVDFSGMHLEGRLDELIDLLSEFSKIRRLSLFDRERSNTLDDDDKGLWQHLDGFIPESIGKFGQLEVLDLKGLMFGGGLPDGVWNPHLRELDCRRCSNLEGKISPLIGKCTLLGYVSLKDTSVGGVIPEEIEGCTGLHTLDLGNTKVSGVFSCRHFAGMTANWRHGLELNALTKGYALRLSDWDCLPRPDDGRIVFMDTEGNVHIMDPGCDDYVVRP